DRPASFEVIFEGLKNVPWDVINEWDNAWARSHGGGATTSDKAPTSVDTSCTNCDTPLRLRVNGAGPQVVTCPVCKQLLQAPVALEPEPDVAVEPVYLHPCPKCKRPLQLRSEFTGKHVRCACSAVFLPGPYRLIVTHGEVANRCWNLTKGEF